MKIWKFFTRRIYLQARPNFSSQRPFVSPILKPSRRHDSEVLLKKLVIVSKILICAPSEKKKKKKVLGIKLGLHFLSYQRAGGEIDFHSRLFVKKTFFHLISVRISSRKLSKILIPLSVCKLIRRVCFDEGKEHHLYPGNETKSN